MAKLNCSQCGGAMKKWTKSSGNALGCAFALLFIAIGIALCFTVVGIPIGLPLMIVALFIGGKREKYWKCKSCKTVLPRA